MELRAWMGYRQDRRKMGFWQTQDGAEVDFLIESDLAVEVKSGSALASADLFRLSLVMARIFPYP